MKVKFKPFSIDLSLYFTLRCYLGDTSSPESDSPDGNNAYLSAACACVAARASLPGAQLYAIVATSTSTSPRENCGESCAPKSK